MFRNKVFEPTLTGFSYRIFIEGLKSAVTKAAYTFAYRYGGQQQQQQQYLPSQDYFIEHYTAMLVEEAEKLYTKLVKDLTNRVVSDMAFNNNNSQSSTLLSCLTLKSNL